MCDHAAMAAVRRAAVSVLGRERATRVARRLGGGDPNRFWIRQVMDASIAAHLDGLGTERLTAVEVSGDLHAARPWKTYTALHYPAFDVCAPAPVGTFDVVICEQVLEHVVDPWAAVRTLHDLCVPGGWVVVDTPFLVRVHGDEPN